LENAIYAGFTAMKHAIVSTSSYLLRVDLTTKEVVPLEGNRTEYYGISWFEDDVELTFSHSGLDNQTLIDLPSYAESELGWISSGARNSRKFLSQPHQILCAPDGRVICTNTGRNVITIIDLEKPGLYQECGIGEARWDRLAPDRKTGDHLNSVFLRNDRLFVIAHRFDKGSQVACFSYPDLEMINVASCGQRSGLHNIWVTDDNQYISCHSEAGAIVDLGSDSVLWHSGSAIYTRGLAASRDYVVVGESQRAGRDLRHSSISALWILDRSTWKAIDYICLGPYGAVHEVRLLDVPDEAHHGKTFRGLPQLMERDMRTDLTASRLDAARAAGDSSAIWRDYELIIGSPETLPGGAKRTGVDSLCLAIRRTKAPQRSFLFEYALEGKGGAAHVSAVLGYHGFGGDTHMTAILLQPTENRAVLTVWQHAGESWSLIPGISADGLPLSSTFYLAISEMEVKVLIESAEVLRLSKKALGLKNCAFPVGVRWIGGTVRPQHAV
jgi:hypothetical protein